MDPRPETYKSELEECIGLLESDGQPKQIGLLVS